MNLSFFHFWKYSLSFLDSFNLLFIRLFHEIFWIANNWIIIPSRWWIFLLILSWWSLLNILWLFINWLLILWFLILSFNLFLLDILRLFNISWLLNVLHRLLVNRLLINWLLNWLLVNRLLIHWLLHRLLINRLLIYWLLVDWLLILNRLWFSVHRLLSWLSRNKACSLDWLFWYFISWNLISHWLNWSLWSCERLSWNLFVLRRLFVVLLWLLILNLWFLRNLINRLLILWSLWSFVSWHNWCFIAWNLRSVIRRHSWFLQMFRCSWWLVCSLIVKHTWLFLLNHNVLRIRLLRILRLWSLLVLLLRGLRVAIG